MIDRNAVFVDTSGWIALLQTDDIDHSRAASVMQELKTKRRSLITSDWVLAETGNGLARLPARKRYVPMVKSILRSSDVELVEVSSAVFHEALALYHKTSDKQWGIVDCTSFAIMRERELRDALTWDQHFEQAGFRCLLRTTI